jgi:pilus assembly protein CpaF
MQLSDFEPTADEISVADPLAFKVGVLAQWKRKKKQFENRFGRGRHLIGSSSYASIMIGDPGSDEICASLLVEDHTITLRCVAPSPVLYVEGCKMELNETRLISCPTKLLIGRDQLTLTPLIVAGGGKESAVQEETLFDEIEESFDSEPAPPTPVVSPLASLKLEPPSLDQIYQDTARKLVADFDYEKLDVAAIDSPKVRAEAQHKIYALTSELDLPEECGISAEQLRSRVFDEVMGLGPLETLLADPTVTEIMVNRRDQIFIERAGRLILTDVAFSSDQALINVIERIVSQVGRRIDTSSPIVDARLLDGSRVNAVIPPLALRGPCLTIRRFSKKPISVRQLIEWGSLSQEMANLLFFLVQSRKNIMISGGTGSGKTTLLNALSGFIPHHERIVTIEDAAELQLQQEHIISLEARPANLEGAGAITIRDLVKNALRMRPDRIIVGECRSGEALDMLQAMNTGHDGSMTTAHANSPEDMLRRLETMVLMAGMELPLKAIREQIASALTLVVQQSRLKDGSRGVTAISWIKGLERDSGVYQLAPLFYRGRDHAVHLDHAALDELWREEELEESPERVLRNSDIEAQVRGEGRW